MSHTNPHRGAPLVPVCAVILLWSGGRWLAHDGAPNVPPIGVPMRVQFVAQSPTPTPMPGPVSPDQRIETPPKVAPPQPVLLAQNKSGAGVWRVGLTHGWPMADARHLAQRSGPASPSSHWSSVIAPAAWPPVSPHAQPGQDQPRHTPPRHTLPRYDLPRHAVAYLAYPYLAAPRTNPAHAPQDRFSASAWALWRPHPIAARTVASGPLLGQSQIGALGRNHVRPAIAVTARANLPMRGTGQEIGLGVSLTPAPHVPISANIEQRVAVDGMGNSRSVAFLTGGAVRPLPRGGLLHGYGQAGVVGRRGIAAWGGARPFADGIIQSEWRVRAAPSTGAAQLMAGVTAAGALDDKTHRVEMGPHLTWGQGTMRGTIGYRYRVSGNDGGPDGAIIITIGRDF